MRCICVHCSWKFGSRLTKPKAVKWTDVHNVLSILKLLLCIWGGFEVGYGLGAVMCAQITLNEIGWAIQHHECGWRAYCHVLFWSLVVYERWTHCFNVNWNRDFGSRLTKSNTVKRAADVHNVMSFCEALLWIWGGFEVAYGFGVATCT
jgi:hypothetical protein